MTDDTIHHTTRIGKRQRNKTGTNPKIHPRQHQERYQDVNKNEIKFLYKIWVDVQYNDIKVKLPLLIAKRDDITPLLGVNLLKQLSITIDKISLDKETD